MDRFGGTVYSSFPLRHHKSKLNITSVSLSKFATFGFLWVSVAEGIRISMSSTVVGKFGFR